MPPEDTQFSGRELQQQAKAESQAQRFEPHKASLEQELEKVVAERHARAGGLDRAITGPSSALGGGGVRPQVRPPGPVRIGPTAQTIVARLANTTKLLYELRELSGGVANTLAGSEPSPGSFGGKSEGSETIFELYANALDEIDRIIDNVVSDQVRARAALG